MEGFLPCGMLDLDFPHHARYMDLSFVLTGGRSSRRSCVMMVDDYTSPLHAVARLDMFPSFLWLWFFLIPFDTPSFVLFTCA